MRYSFSSSVKQAMLLFHKSSITVHVREDQRQTFDMNFFFSSPYRKVLLHRIKLTSHIIELWETMNIKMKIAYNKHVSFFKVTLI